MKENLKSPLILLCAALMCSIPGFAQGGGGFGGRGGRGAGGAPTGPRLIGGRFKAYPQDAIARGLTAYNTNCGYCHGDHASGGHGGPDLVAGDVALHDEDGVGIGAFLKSDAHQKAAKLDLPQSTVYDIAAFIHSRIIAAANRSDPIHMEDVEKAGNAQAGEAYFNGAGGCAKCHSVTGDLKGIGSKFDAAALQDRIVNPRAGRGRGGRGRGGAPVAGPPDPNAITATVTLANGKTFTGIPVRVSDFDVTLRMADGSEETWARDNGVPKVEEHNPLAAHLVIMTKLTDSEMHNLTAYLETLK